MSLHLWHLMPLSRRGWVPGVARPDMDTAADAARAAQATDAALDAALQQQRGRSPPPRRLHWTEDLHRNFMVCVEELGGPFKATPLALLQVRSSLVVVWAGYGCARIGYSCIISGCTFADTSA